jgi:hypothetical protein
MFIDKLMMISLISELLNYLEVKLYKLYKTAK